MSFSRWRSRAFGELDGSPGGEQAPPPPRRPRRAPFQPSDDTGLCGRPLGGRRLFLVTGGGAGASSPARMEIEMWFLTSSR